MNTKLKICRRIPLEATKILLNLTSPLRASPVEYHNGVLAVAAAGAALGARLCVAGVRRGGGGGGGGRSQRRRGRGGGRGRLERRQRGHGHARRERRRRRVDVILQAAAA